MQSKFQRHILSPATHPSTKTQFPRWLAPVPSFSPASTATWRLHRAYEWQELIFQLCKIWCAETPSIIHGSGHEYACAAAFFFPFFPPWNAMEPGCLRPHRLNRSPWNSRNRPMMRALIASGQSGHQCVANYCDCSAPGSTRFTEISLYLIAERFTIEGEGFVQRDSVCLKALKGRKT